MRHASLFSGIGGFDLAAQWMGWENVFQVEIDEFCQKVLAKNFPNAKRYGDIKQFDGTEWTGQIDILTGGFPCQPYSSAGKRKGKEDDRHLWPEMLRVIGEVQPTYVVGENVYGLVNWSRGLVFNEVQTDLENAGYEVTPFILPACGVNAPHRRDRVWFVAHAASSYDKGDEREFSAQNGRSMRNDLPTSDKSSSGLRGERAVANGNSQRIQRWQTPGDIEIERQGAKQLVRGYNQRNDWQVFPTESPIRGGDDGLPANMDVDKRIQALGNAIVPQVAFEIFKAIESCAD